MATESRAVYLILVDDAEGADRLFSAPVDPADATYLLDRIAQTLQPLTRDEYRDGPAAILMTGAKFSYVLASERLYWCVECDPGLLVIRFSPQGEMAWTAIRSPVPNFGGREASQAEIDAWDEDEENPQYNLVFIPWDAAFDEDYRQALCFEPADAKTVRAREQALAQTIAPGDEIAAFSKSERQEWGERALERISVWAGEGVRSV